MSRYALDVRGYNAGGPEYTIQGFWECECDENYIHRTDAEPTCPTCGYSHDECPDAFLENVVRLPDLTEQERLDIAEVTQQARLEYYRKGRDHQPVATLWPYQSKLGHAEEPMGKLIELLKQNMDEEDLRETLRLAFNLLVWYPEDFMVRRLGEEGRLALINRLADTLDKA